MEQRTAKVNISSAGGTASQGSRTCKVTLPTKWLKEMGVTKKNRALHLAFDGTKITLSPPLDGAEFAKQRWAMGHLVKILRFFDEKTLCSIIYADFAEHTLVVENEDVPPFKTAFGNNLFPSWNDFQQFLEERCVPRQRAGLREYLEALGLGEYDPMAIIEKTGGHMAEDQQWLSVEVYS